MLSEKKFNQKSLSECMLVLYLQKMNIASQIGGIVNFYQV